MKAYKSIRFLAIIASLFTFLAACQSNDAQEVSLGQETETIKASEEQTASQTESAVEVTEMLLPPDYSKERTTPITHVMLHYTSNVTTNPEDPYNVEDNFQTFKDYGVSAHYLIDREGMIYQLVEDNRVAYHAGAGSLPSFPDYEDKLNEYSIGIELMAIGTQQEMELFIPEDTYSKLNPSFIGYTDAQYEALEELLEQLHTQYPKVKRNREHVIGHDEYAPNRKTDPGELFDWERICS